MQSGIRFVLVLTFGVLLGAGPARAQDQHQTADAQPAAKTLFGQATKAAALAPQAIGFYSRGCLAGAQALPLDGPHWQAMRPSRQRMWGHPELIRFLERFAPVAAQASAWPGILVGDMAQARGGPMLTGHASHQLGLDADIWLKPMPVERLSQAQREQVSSISVVRADRLDVDPATWTAGHQAVLRAAAMDPQVQRVFANAAIKRELCRSAKGASWLRKIRPEQGHDYHFHVRLFCPEGETQCKAQDPTPEGDGCDASLDWWFSEEALHPKPPAKPTPPLTLADLPADCRQVLEARGATPTTPEVLP
ncbi:penicillin-insensitive murein endopeptidase [Paucibacter sp. B2R-40]|uniref:penicillin-insensitive murein endopeptidase n=1 Tax=Paucibacter sp. B2R-40 TaxID=2893554 RepID=UPI0021E3B0E3|nr:penicillin-insensitive murein endopeptidase [Paucibacter sp. B2R-40]MCV2356627.1 penicillin-insensitive murein endopeptidase [Paucibacter sp. B2R-40]